MLKKARIHLTLWLFLTMVNVGFAINIFYLETAIVAALLNSFFPALLFYTNYFIIFPRYYKPHKNGLFFVFTFLVILFFALIQCWIDYSYITKLAIIQRPPHVNKHIFIFFRGFFWMWLVDLIGIMLLLQERIKEQTVHAQKIKEEQLKTELKLLKAQINPHFVFNALNNIYSLTYTKSDHAPASILKLSQMLRYVFEECSKDKVSLMSEIEYIENFISFQRMKSPLKQDIQFEHHSVDGAKRIAPMLFIPFIENSFKYSKIEEEKSAYVRMQIEAKHHKLRFTIRNSIPELNSSKSGAGMGLANVRQRLDIIYKDCHHLDITREKYEFRVALEINLS